MQIEAEIRDIKQWIMEISKKIDSLLYEKEILPIMKLEEKSSSDFLEEEPDIYKLKDLKKRYR